MRHLRLAGIERLVGPGSFCWLSGWGRTAGTMSFDGHVYFVAQGGFCAASAPGPKTSKQAPI
jgi:hypothetical protein